MQTEDIIDSLISDVFQLLDSPRLPDTPDLDALFLRLQTEDAAESMIWQRWCSHQEPEARAAMADIIATFDDGSIDRADRDLEILVSRWPTWAEAWNKRATLRFVQERDIESLQDIVRTLALEPRHFGALGGFGQICLRVGEPHAGLLGFKKAIEINPHMTSALAEIITDLETYVAQSTH